MGHFDYWVWVVGIAWIDTNHNAVWEEHEGPLPGVSFIVRESGTNYNFDQSTTSSDGIVELEAHWACEAGISCEPNPECDDLGSRLVVIASAPEGFFPTTPSTQHVLAENDTLYFGFGHWN